MLGLENEVVVVFGRDAPDQRLTPGAVAQAMLQQLVTVRLPSTEIVVDVDDGHPGGFSPPPQLLDVPGDRQCGAQ
jgi:hypothetical protein